MRRSEDEGGVRRKAEMAPEPCEVIERDLAEKVERGPKEGGQREGTVSMSKKCPISTKKKGGAVRRANCSVRARAIKKGDGGPLARQLTSPRKGGERERDNTEPREREQRDDRGRSVPPTRQRAIPELDRERGPRS